MGMIIRSSENIASLSVRAKSTQRSEAELGEELRSRVTVGIHAPPNESRDVHSLLQKPLTYIHVGGDYEYTKEQALQRLHAGSFNMYTGEKHQNTEETGFSIDRDRFYTSQDMNATTSYVDRLKQNLEYMASRYAVLKDRAVNSSALDAVAKVDEMMQAYAEKLAQQYADSFYKIFEDNGITGEKERIVQSVLAAFSSRTAEYDSLLDAVGKDMDFSEGAWLKTDSAYVSSQLRHAMEKTASVTEAPSQVEEGELYSLEDLESLRAFAKELKLYAEPSAGFTNSIHRGSESEESLGAKLGELKLKGRVFQEKATASDRVKDVVTRSINAFIENTLRQEQAYMDHYTQLQIQAVQGLLERGRHPGYTSQDAADDIVAIRKNFTALDRDAVFRIIDKMDEVYSRTGDVGISIMDGHALAFDAYRQKTQSEAYDGVERYDYRSSYWNGFYGTTGRVTLATDTKDFEAAWNRYTQKVAGRTEVAQSWNNFMGKVSNREGVLFREVEFSVYI